MTDKLKSQLAVFREVWASSVTSHPELSYQRNAHKNESFSKHYCDSACFFQCGMFLESPAG
jgi:hypothetical protein